MVVVIPSGKEVKVDEKEIQHFMQVLDLSEEEAISTWLSDHDYITDEEQEELDNKAKKVKIKHDASAKDKRKNSKPRTVKISQEKQDLFINLYEFLTQNYENCTVLKQNKLFSVQINDKTFKIDLIEQRKPKNGAN